MVWLPLTSGEPCSTALGTILSQKSSPMMQRSLELIVNHSEKLKPLYPLSVCASEPTIEQLRKDTSQDFCPWGGNTPSFKSVVGKGMFSPNMTQGIQGILTSSYPLSPYHLPLLLPQSTTAIPGSTPVNGTHFQKHRILAPLFARTCNSHFLTIPASVVWKECFFGANLMC